jgi:hypothetical protein
MSEDNSQTISSILSGQGIEILEYPEGGMDEIEQPGFYYNSQAAQIEHWSEPCEYNNVMRSHFSNRHGIIQDGFQSVLAFEDIVGLSNSIQNWHKHLIRYGVV